MLRSVIRTSLLGSPTTKAPLAQRKAQQEAEAANVMRQRQLTASIDEQRTVGSTCVKLLTMYAHRVNGAWLENYDWCLPKVRASRVATVKGGWAGPGNAVMAGKDGGSRQQRNTAPPRRGTVVQGAPGRAAIALKCLS